MRALLALAVLLAGAPPAPRGPRPRPAPGAAAEAAPGTPTSRGKAIAHYLAARRCQDAGDLGCAAAELQQAVDFDGDSAELRVALAEALAARGDLTPAGEEARRALALSGNAGADATRAHLLLAQLARRRDREEAALELRQAVRVESAAAAAGGRLDPEPWSLLALLYLELGDEPAAQRALDDLAERAPAEDAAEREVGRWLLEHGQAGRAEHHLRRALSAARQDLSAWRLLVRVHRALGRAPEVKDDLRALLELSPDDAEALLGLGREALEENDPERARELFERELRAAPDRAAAAAVISAEWLGAGRPEEALAAAREPRLEDARLRLAEGLALSALRRHAEAARALEQVSERDGELFLPARVALASALARTGKHAAAARALELPLLRWPGDVQLTLAQAATLEWAGRASAAAEALLRAAEERERRGEASAAEALRAARAGLLCRAGRAREAVAALRPAVDARPRSVSLRLALAAALDEAGTPEQRAEAEAELRALLALAPEEPAALARLAVLLGRGGAGGAVEQGPAPGGSPSGSPGAGGARRALDEAEELARRAVKLAPRSPEALGALGQVLSARGDHASAVAALERAVSLSGRSARWLGALGEACAAAGRPEEAAAAWRAALLAADDEPPPVAERLRATLRRSLSRTR